MLKCSNCKSMYEHTEERCPKCGLKDGVIVEDTVQDWVHLTTVANDIEFGMVAGLLEMANIPVMREVKGIDAYLQVIIGVPLSGVNVLVPRARLEEAAGLIESKIDEKDLEQETK